MRLTAQDRTGGIVSFAEQPFGPVVSVPAEAGPALWPAALPAWLSSVPLTVEGSRTWRPLLLAVIASVHLVALSAFLSQAGAIDLAKLGEQSRLTLIRVTQSLQAETKKEPEVAAEPTDEAMLAEGAPPTPIEWARVPNWRRKANGSTATTSGEGSGYDATRLLAGLGASGPAGAADGVADPYAGASPVWAGNGARSELLLIGAPNPAVLEQIRQRVAMTFRGIHGFAKLAVAIDREGVVTGIVRMETDLPEAARSLLEASLLGRVIGTRRSASQTMELPVITFD